MPEPCPPHLDPALLEGMRLFDAGLYHEAHEAWEELWMDEVGRVELTVKALIQLSVALYHRERGNVVGAARLFLRAADILQRLPDALLELDLRDLENRCRRLADEVRTQADRAPPCHDPALVPHFGEQRDRALAERRRRGLPSP